VRRLAFLSNIDGREAIYSIDVDTSALTRLADDPAPDTTPAWSPDGRHFAYVAGTATTSDIVIVELDGLQRRRLTAPDTGRNAEPAWSPAGRRIAFTSSRGGNDDVYAVNIDGSRLAQLTTHPARDFSPLWTPNGRQIAFASSRGESSRLLGREYGSQIYLMEADGSAVEALTRDNACRLTHASEGKFNALRGAAWTPDGRHLLYRAGVCKFDCRVCVIDRRERRVYPLTEQRSVRFSLSPDGQLVAYDLASGVYRAPLRGGMGTLRGGAATLLAPEGAGPAWSRDGKRIAFLAHGDIWLVDADGGSKRKLTTRSGSYWSLAWSPGR
jgi:Tol biopolymer transport system component